MISQKLFKDGIFTFIVVISLVLIFLPGQFLGIPPLPELIKIIEGYYAQYGYWIVFFGAFLESILFISWNFPGSTVVILGAVFSGIGILSFPLVIIIAFIGFMLGYLFDYFLGYYGYHRLFQKLGFRPIDKMRAALQKRGMFALFLFYIQPQLGVFSSTACGVMRIAFRKFIVTALVSVLFWSLFWGGLAYFIGGTLLAYTDSWWFRLLLWMIIIGMAAVLLVPERKLK